MANSDETTNIQQEEKPAHVSQSNSTGGVPSKVEGQATDNNGTGEDENRKKLCKWYEKHQTAIFVMGSIIIGVVVGLIYSLIKDTCQWKHLESLPPWLYVAFAVSGSVFYACRALLKKWNWGSGHELIHQVWFNFLGSAAGWAILWLLWLRTNKVKVDVQSSFDIWNVLLFVLSFIGITGYLPQTIVGLVGTIGEAVKKLAGIGK